MQRAKFTKLTILFAVLILAILSDLTALFQSSVAVGIDGYYYVLQINSLLNHGQLYFSAQTPVILYLLGFLSLIFANTVFAIKIGAIILQILLCLGVFSLIKIITENFWLGLLGLSIAAFSNLHFYLLGEFLNQLGGLVLLIWCFFGIVKLLQTKNFYWLCLILPTFFLAVFSHRSIIFLAFIIFVLIYLSYLFIKSESSKMKSTIAAIFVLLFFLPMIIAWQTFFILPDWLKFEVLRIPQIPFQSTNITEASMLAVTIFSAIILPFNSANSSQAKLVLLTVTGWILLTTLNPFLNHLSGFQGITVRLDCLAYLQAALVIPTAISLWLEKSKTVGFGLAAAFIALLIYSYFLPVPYAMQIDYLQTREKLIQSLPEMKQQLCENPIVIAQHGEQFVVTAILKVPSQQTIPSAKYYQCVFWLIRKPTQEQNKDFVKNFKDFENEFNFVKDSDLRTAFKKYSETSRQMLIRLNPHLLKIGEF